MVRVPFRSATDELSVAATATDRYNLRHDEIYHTFDVITDENGTSTEAPLRPPRPLDLLRLGVVRMFRLPLYEALPIKKGNRRDFDLSLDTTACPPVLPDGWTEWHQSAEDPSIFQSVSGDDSTQRKAWTVGGHFLTSPESIIDTRLRVQRWLDSLDDEGYDILRMRATHRKWTEEERGGWTDATEYWGRSHPLRDEGFWNAMHEELGPSALRYLRDEGTFYHLLPDNPNAVEWGIFWLRMFRTEGLALTGIQGGTAELVRKLCAKLRGYSHVRLRPAQEVLSISASGTGIRMRVRDRRNGREYEAEADHCVLALPLAPLSRFEHSFPEAIQEDLRSVFGFTLLKAFLHVRNPWWRHEVQPHTGAGGIATRELHFQREPSRGTDGWVPNTEAQGLAMVYTDHPASEFWRPYVASPVHFFAPRCRGRMMPSSLHLSVTC